MRSQSSRMGPTSNMICVLITRGEDTERQEKEPCADGSRDWGNADVSLRTPEIAGTMHEKLGRNRKTLSVKLLEKAWSC